GGRRSLYPLCCLERLGGHPFGRTEGGGAVAHPDQPKKWPRRSPRLPGHRLASPAGEAALGPTFDDVGAAAPAVARCRPITLQVGEVGQIVERLAHVKVFRAQCRLENAEAALEQGLCLGVATLIFV